MPRGVLDPFRGKEGEKRYLHVGGGGGPTEATSYRDSFRRQRDSDVFEFLFLQFLR